MSSFCFFYELKGVCVLYTGEVSLRGCRESICIGGLVLLFEGLYLLGLNRDSAAAEKDLVCVKREKEIELPV